MERDREFETRLRPRGGRDGQPPVESQACVDRIAAVVRLAVGWRCMFVRAVVVPLDLAFVAPFEPAGRAEIRCEKIACPACRTGDVAEAEAAFVLLLGTPAIAGLRTPAYRAETRVSAKPSAECSCVMP